MNKSFRQGQIVKILRKKQIFTQDELATALAGVGIQTTQVTLSRDMRELGLVKTADGYRALPAETNGPSFSDAANDFLLDIRLAQNIVILKTAPAHASSLAIALDNEEMPQVVGTIAGDDTVMVVTPDSKTAVDLKRKIISLLSD